MEISNIYNTDKLIKQIDILRQLNMKPFSYEKRIENMCRDLQFIRDCDDYYIRILYSANHTAQSAITYSQACIDLHIDELIIDKDHKSISIYTGSLHFKAHELLFGFSRKDISEDPIQCFKRLGIIDPITRARIDLQKQGYDLKLIRTPFSSNQFLLYLCFPKI